MGVFFCVGLCWVCFLVLWFVFLWFLRFLFSFLHWSSCRLTSVWFILSRSICLWTVFYPDWRCHTSKQKKSFQWQGCVTKKGTHWSSKVNFFFLGSPRGWFCHSNAPNTIATELAKSICGILLLHVCFCNYIILAQVHAVGVYQLLDNFVNLIVLIPFFPFTSRVNGNNAIGPLIMFQGAAWLFRRWDFIGNPKPGQISWSGDFCKEAKVHLAKEPTLWGLKMKAGLQVGQDLYEGMGRQTLILFVTS